MAPNAQLTMTDRPCLRRVVDCLRHGQPGESVRVQGWVRTKREQKKFTFAEINDGSSLKSIQAVIDAAVPGYGEAIAAMNTGASVAISGTLVPSPAQGQSIELKAESIEVLGSVAEDYPLQKNVIPLNSLEALPTCVPAPTPSAR